MREMRKYLLCVISLLLTGAVWASNPYGVQLTAEDMGYRGPVCSVITNDLTSGGTIIDEFDSEGRVTHRRMTDIYAKQVFDTVYEWGEDGRLACINNRSEIGHNKAYRIKVSVPQAFTETGLVRCMSSSEYELNWNDNLGWHEVPLDAVASLTTVDTYTYDAQGRLDSYTTMSDGREMMNVGFEYDRRGNLAKMEISMDVAGTGYVTKMKYDRFDRMVRMKTVMKGSHKSSSRIRYGGDERTMTSVDRGRAVEGDQVLRVHKTVTTATLDHYGNCTSQVRMVKDREVYRIRRLILYH